DGASLSLTFGAGVQGQSVVVRPLGEKKSCKELGKLLNVFDFKTAIPLKAERIARMETGEVWRLPLTVSISATPAVGVPVAPQTTVSLHLGASDNGTVTATLYRMGPKQLRFRFRLQRAFIREAGGSA